MSRRRKLTKAHRDEIKRKLAKVKKKMRDIKAYRRLTALRMFGTGKSLKEISEATEYSAQYITELVTKYLKEGLESIVTDKRTSNNRRMSFDGEVKFLEQFVELADAGQIVTVECILCKYEEETGKESNTSTIYKLLKRHGWRKLKPRPKHPNGATDEEIASSKKLTKNSGNSYWKKIEEISATSIKSTNV